MYVSFIKHIQAIIAVVRQRRLFSLLSSQHNLIHIRPTQLKRRMKVFPISSQLNDSQIFKIQLKVNVQRKRPNSILRRRENKIPPWNGENCRVVHTEWYSIKVPLIYTTELTLEIVRLTLRIYTVMLIFRMLELAEIYQMMMMICHHH